MIKTLPLLFDDVARVYAVGVIGHKVSWHSYSEMPISVLQAIYDLTGGTMMGLPNLAAKWSLTYR